MSAHPGKALKAKPERRQRRYPRFRVEFPVRIVVFSGMERQRLDAHCLDLSIAGMGVLLAAELPPGEVAALDFCLPGKSAAWSIRAVLRHRRGYNYGFEFLSLSDDQNRALAELLPTLERADREADVAQRKS
jgi:c-di-GMP-binding flagellar brake protein YcgR